LLGHTFVEKWMKKKNLTILFFSFQEMDEGDERFDMKMKINIFSTKLMKKPK
jgi:hypothetical protein